MLLSPCLSKNEQGHLAIGGIDVPSLAKEYGTPLYIMDETLIRETCRAYQNAMREHYSDDRFLVVYAGKAFCTKYMYRILEQEGMGADLVSGGELYTAIQAKFPLERAYFHGNNKTEQELALALDAGVHRFVVDNREELLKIDEMASARNMVAEISFRVKPGIDAHTHDFIQTGQIDSKFGVALENGEVMQIVAEAIKLKGVRVVGLHCHIGSQIFENEPFCLAAKVMMKLISDIRAQFGVTIGELNLGGGFGVRYTKEDDPLPIETTIANLAASVKSAASEFGLDLPFLVIEPGRSIVAPSGITVYTVGSVKQIKNVRTYVSVDGGMTDNPRFALYNAEYTAVLPERINAEPSETVTIAGRCCESGDLIGKDMKLPPVQAGDLLAIQTTGAYNYSMASNYNRVPKPPVIMVRDGKAKMIVRRESYDDLLKNDICE